jgi:hypothetical protein
MAIMLPLKAAPIAVAAMLWAPAFGLAQGTTQMPAARPAAPPSPPAAAPATPGTQSADPATAPSTLQQRVEQRIKELHGQLRITAQEEPQWDQFAAVMRDNARAMDAALQKRGRDYANMTAVQNLQSYEELAEMHAKHLQKLTEAFGKLYESLPPQQRKLADAAFRARAEARAQQRGEASGSSR